MTLNPNLNKNLKLYQNRVSLFCFCQVVKESFAVAAAEPKLTSRSELLQRNAAATLATAGRAEVGGGDGDAGGGSSFGFVLVLFRCGTVVLFSSAMIMR